MFDILVYLYETYYRPDACPDTPALVKKLSAVGFPEDEISEALDWLTGLANTSDQAKPEELSSTGFRVYAKSEMSALGVPAVGFIQFLESAGLLNSFQREILIERALAVKESPLPLDKLRIIVLMVLWSQGAEPDMLMFDDLLLSDDDNTTRLLH
jgi:Smg protein